LPSQITLKNDAPDFLDILIQLGKDVVQAFVDLGQAIKDFFTNDADYVGTGGFVLDPSWLNELAVGSEKLGTVNIDGGDSEGRYDVNFAVKKVSQNDVEVESTYEVRITTFKCLTESNEFSSSDEPFLMAILSSFPGEKQSHLTDSYDDVDAGESRTVGKTFSRVSLN
jgi:hypothetical protein